MYFSGQGVLAFAEVGSNKLIEVGNCPEIGVELNAESTEHTESTTGQRMTDLSLTRKKSAKLTLTLEEFTLDNLALGLYGTKTTIEGDSVEDEVLGAVTPGDVYKLAQGNVSALVLCDSSATPVTLEPNVDYTLNAAFGTVKFNATDTVNALTAPVLADYDYGAAQQVAMFTQTPPVRRLVCRIINTADDDAPYLVELYKVKIDPLGKLPLIQEELGSLELTGSALVDVNTVNDPELGMFGRVVKL